MNIRLMATGILFWGLVTVASSSKKMSLLGVSIWGIHIGDDCNQAEDSLRGKGFMVKAGARSGNRTDEVVLRRFSKTGESLVVLQCDRGKIISVQGDLIITTKRVLRCPFEESLVIRELGRPLVATATKVIQGARMRYEDSEGLALELFVQKGEVKHGILSQISH